MTSAIVMIVVTEKFSRSLVENKFRDYNKYLPEKIINNKYVYIV